MSSGVDVVVRAKVALKSLPIKILIEIKPEKALETID